MATVTNILIDNLRHNKRTAQERLLSLYGEMVFRQIARIVTRQEDAEDIYQDVFVKVPVPHRRPSGQEIRARGERLEKEIALFKNQIQ